MYKMIEIVQFGFLDGVLGFLVHKILYVSLSQLVSFIFVPNYTNSQISGPRE